MHLLITNDDGYQAIGIRTLAKKALERGHTILFCAPSKEQSAMSHRLTLFQPLIARPFSFENQTGYHVNGSPVDCARVGLNLTEQPFDFCLSGINHGENVGTGIFYSGTNAAAREATMNNLRAIAVSVQHGAQEEHWALAADTALDLMERIKDRPMPRLTFLNINVPSLPIQQILPMKTASISDAFFLDGYEARLSPRKEKYFWLQEEVALEAPRPGTDLDLLRRGHITCTMVGGLMDRNDYLAFLPEA